MHKKLIMACMAIAAFVIAPAASASPVLTENPTPIPVGASVTAKNTGVVKFTGIAECSTAHFAGTVTNNSGTKVEIEIPLGSASFTGTGTSSDCTSSLGSVRVFVTSKICLATSTTDNLPLTGCGGNIVIDWVLTGTGECKYSTASVGSSFATNVTPAVVTVTEQPLSKAEGGIFCLASTKLDMTLDLSTTSGVGVGLS
ncbi:MAG: hypothetical protein ACTHLH_06420 [Solirubrobacterales bacterium]